MVFADGSELEADLVVFSAGIRPRDELARAAGLAVGERGGIVIDDALPHLATRDIFAIGECALCERHDLRPGRARLRDGARSRRAHLARRATQRFAGADMCTKLKLLGVDVASFGDAFGAHARRARAQRLRRPRQRRLQEAGRLRATASTLLGGILVGDAADYGTLLQIALNRHAAARAPGGR